ncbi:ATP-binding protein [Methanobrevibacter oralis]|uniref:ATP-binding protein n=1 Tax=Methanobrevibacter oralis TaxID=66851 RepID=UPI002FCDACDD
MIYDKNENIFMIFTGSSALNLEYNADASRRMLKKIITPLNYNQHLKLKYNIDLNHISEALEKIIFTGEIKEAINYEKEAKSTIINNINYSSYDWNEYFKYGGFPFLFNDSNPLDITSKLIDICEKIVNTDMINIKNFTAENQANAKRILRFIALQEPGEASQAKLSNYLKTSTGNVKNILDILEKTQLLVHCEPYGGEAKRIKKSWKYYFATPSLHNVLSSKYGNNLKNSNEYEGILLENLVASTLFNIRNRKNNHFHIYYDVNKKNNVDFIIKKDFENPIPIEVGHGNKNKKQIINAIKRYKANYGIIVSNKTTSIQKEDNIIFIPKKTFSLL